MATYFASHVQAGDHASRPAANAVAVGTLYACSDHGKIYQSDGSTWSDWFAGGSADHYTIPYLFGDGVNVITTGLKGGLVSDVAGTIIGATLLGLDGLTGSIVVDVWKDTYANHPPTIADTITASAKPTISADVKSQDTTLTGWSPTITAGDVLFFNVDSAATFKLVGLYLTVLKA